MKVLEEIIKIKEMDGDENRRYRRQMPVLTAEILLPY